MTVRLRVLELPTRPDPAGYRTPFVLVLDRFNDADAAVTPALLDRLAAASRRIGAESFLVFPFEVDLPAVLERWRTVDLDAAAEILPPLKADRPLSDYRQEVEYPDPMYPAEKQP